MAASGATPPAPPRRRKRRRWLDGYLPPYSEEERARLIAEPGPSWREYFLRDFLRWWGLLFFFIVDALLVASFLPALKSAGPIGRPSALAVIGELLAALAAASYLEMLLYAYCWRRPDPDRESRRGPFVRRWYRPFRYGRFTPEFEQLKAGVDPAHPRAPNPEEFL